MCSCHKQSSSDTNDKNFDTISFNTIAKKDFPGQNPLNVPVETDYDNIKVELENNVYPLDFDEIIAFILMHLRILHTHHKTPSYCYLR